jgi:[ribosomal protein S18]-alanine N-acetyltransferase
VNVRRATTDDLAVIVALETAVFGPGAWSEHAVREELAPGRTLVVAENAAGAVAGYAALWVAGDTADVLRVAVAVEHRRAGVGTALLAALLGQARAGGCRAVLLEVEAGNVAALGLYERFGFEPVSHRAAYYADGRGAVVMRAALAR